MSVTYIYSATGNLDKKRDRVFDTPEELIKWIEFHEGCHPNAKYYRRNEDGSEDVIQLLEFYHLELSIGNETIYVSPKYSKYL